MLIKIEAIVREEKMEDVKAALNEIQVNGFTVTQIMGVEPSVVIQSMSEVPRLMYF